MKFDQLIKYDKENIFLKRLYRKCGGGTIPKFFGKKSKLSESLDWQSEILKVCFYSVSILRSINIC